MEYAPVESLNRADILLGVTRAIQSNSGSAASSSGFNYSLKVIESDLNLGVGEVSLSSTDLARNLIRRQGRYWKGLGILAPKRGPLTLTPLGRDYASGVMTNDDFVCITIDTHEVPNVRIDSAETVAKWKASGIKLKPLRLIVDILNSLESFGPAGSAYLTPNEVCKVVVPLAILTQDAEFHRKAIVDYRTNPSAFNTLPNCTPESNDARMVREHLLFLKYFSVLEVTTGKEERFFLDHNYQDLLDQIFATSTVVPNGSSTATPPPTAQVTREKKLVEITARPNQAAFRKKVFASCSSRCLLTGEVVSEVLAACHIHEVKDGGSDDTSNGIVLRSDLHILFDKNKLRISETGQVVFAPDVAVSPVYSSLPTAITLPSGVDLNLMKLRFRYGKVILDT